MSSLTDRSDLDPTDDPQPGTLAFQNPEPELVTKTLALVASGKNRRDAVAILRASNRPRHDVEAAHTYWVRQMHRFAWEDYKGTHVLMILEDMLRETPRGDPS